MNSLEYRARILDSIKGIAMIMIITTHFAWTSEERLFYLFPFWVNMAVPILFIISGITNSMSFQRRNIQTFGDAYLLTNWFGRIIKYSIPYAVIFCYEMFRMRAWEHFTTLQILKIALSGSFGPGSYFYPILIQFVFLFPIIYFIVKKNQVKGLYICFLLNALFELLKWAYSMNGECYRLLIFRYIFVIAIGCYLTQGCRKISNFKIFMGGGILGAAYIYKVCYTGYKMQIITYWEATSFIACLFIIPFFVLIFLKCKKCCCKPLELIGKASYHIFLVQMVYYQIDFSMVCNLISTRKVQLAVSVFICIVIGIFYYYIDKPLETWIRNRIILICNKSLTKYNS